MLFYRKLLKSCKRPLAALQIADIIDVDNIAENNKNERKKRNDLFTLH